MKIKKFKIRCSAIGQIMTNSRKKGELSKTAQTYCKDWLKEHLYERKKEFSSKYTQKGNEMEDNGLDYIAEQLDLGMLIQNEQFFENDFMTGTPDVVLKDYDIDQKNSWSWETFPLFETEIPEKNYWWQGQGYMGLTKRDKYKLIYVLQNTPDHLIMSEAKRYCYQNGYDDLTKSMYQEFHDKITYDKIPDNLKIKIFEFEIDHEAIKAIESRVIECREYIETLIKSIK